MISHSVGLMSNSFVAFFWPHLCSCVVLVGQPDWKVQDGFIFSWCLLSAKVTCLVLHVPLILPQARPTSQGSSAKEQKLQCPLKPSLRKHIYHFHFTVFVKANPKSSLDWGGGQAGQCGGDRLSAWEKWHGHIAKKYKYQVKRNLWPLYNLPQWQSTDLNQKSLSPLFPFKPHIQAITKS